MLLLLLPPGTGPRAACPMGSPGACRLFQVPVPGVPFKQILRLRPRRDRGAPGRARVSPKEGQVLLLKLRSPTGSGRRARALDGPQEQSKPSLGARGGPRSSPLRAL